MGTLQHILIVHRFPIIIIIVCLVHYKLQTSHVLKHPLNSEMTKAASNSAGTSTFCGTGPQIKTEDTRTTFSEGLTSRQKELG